MVQTGIRQKFSEHKTKTTTNSLRYNVIRNTQRTDSGNDKGFLTKSIKYHFRINIIFLILSIPRVRGQRIQYVFGQLSLLRNCKWRYAHFRYCNVQGGSNMTGTDCV